MRRARARRRGCSRRRDGRDGTEPGCRRPPSAASIQAPVPRNELADTCPTRNPDEPASPRLPSPAELAVAQQPPDGLRACSQRIGSLGHREVVRHRWKRLAHVSETVAPSFPRHERFSESSERLFAKRATRLSRTPTATRSAKPIMANAFSYRGRGAGTQNQLAVPSRHRQEAPVPQRISPGRQLCPTEEAAAADLAAA
jgi:hypothetical protein